jgi:hypothetical protein
MLSALQKAKLKELEEAYLVARYRGREEEATFWNRELAGLLIEVLSDSGDTETTSGTDSGESQRS